MSRHESYYELIDSWEGEWVLFRTELGFHSGVTSRWREWTCDKRRQPPQLCVSDPCPVGPCDVEECHVERSRGDIPR